MLDKNVPYYRIIMKRKADEKIKKAFLPDGFTFTLFKKGDEKDWAAIESSVGEFESEEKALDYFEKKYLPYIEKLKVRTVFVSNVHGEKVATFTAWHTFVDGVKYPMVHWVACKPSYQGMGIGKAIILYGVSLMIKLDGNFDMYLATQTWSHKAISLYMLAGFTILKDEKTYGKYKNQGIKGYEEIKEYIEKANQ